VRLDDGDVQVRAYTMSPAGTWNIGWRVAYAFAFAPPTQGPPTVNVVQKNSLIPTWFTLGGNQGLDIFLHAPTWREVPCWPNAPQHLVPKSHDPRLSYDPLTDRYEYVKSYWLNWVGTCRVMRMTFVDGTVARARYRLR
jgi:hypothetical protein